MAHVVKFALNGDLRRARPEPPWSAETLGEIARQVYGTLLPPGFEMKYRDEDGDLCTLTPATLSDFLALHEGKPMARIELMAQVAAVAAGSPFVASQDADMGGNGGQPQPQPPTPQPQPQQQEQQQPHLTPLGTILGLPLQLAGILPGLCSGLLGGDATIAVLVHFAPILLPHLEANQAAVDQFFRSHREALLPLLTALREGLEPFPQFQEVHWALDRLRQPEHLEGLGSALSTLMRTLLLFPKEQQLDVAAVALSGILDKAAAILSLLSTPGAGSGASGDALEAPVHAGVVCDACNVSPIIGPRFKCAACLDYDLCATCYLRKDQLHPGQHRFELIPQTGHHALHRHQNRHRDPLGQDKKGWRRCDFGASSSSGGLSSSSTSGQQSGSSKGEHGQWRKSHKEAKKRLKQQIKAAKQAFRQEKKAWKQQWKAWKKYGKHGRADGQVETPQPMATSMDAASTAASLAPAAPESAESPLQVLVEMGFDNIELLAQLLAIHHNNVQKVVEVLAGGVFEGIEESAAMQC